MQECELENTQNGGQTEMHTDKHTDTQTHRGVYRVAMQLKTCPPGIFHPTGVEHVQKHNSNFR